MIAGVALVVPFCLRMEPRRVTITISLACPVFCAVSTIFAMLARDRVEKLITGTCRADGSPLWYCWWNVVYQSLFCACTSYTAVLTWDMALMTPKRALGQFYMLGGFYMIYVGGANLAEVFAAHVAGRSKEFWFASVWKLGISLEASLLGYVFCTSCSDMLADEPRSSSAPRGREKDERKRIPSTLEESGHHRPRRPPRA